MKPELTDPEVDALVAAWVVAYSVGDIREAHTISKYLQKNNIEPTLNATWIRT